MKTETFDYNNLIKREEINVLNVVSDSTKDVIDFEYNGRYFEQRYNKGNGWGFKFITEYANEFHIRNKSSVAAKTERIYSAMNATDFGKFLEFSLMKMNLKK